MHALKACNQTKRQEIGIKVSNSDILSKHLDNLKHVLPCKNSCFQRDKCPFQSQSAYNQ